MLWLSGFELYSRWVPLRSQVSGLCGPQFLSYLPKRFDPRNFVELVWRRHIGGLAAGNQQEHLEFTFSIKALSFDSRTSIPTHKHIF